MDNNRNYSYLRGERRLTLEALPQLVLIRTINSYIFNEYEIPNPARIASTGVVHYTL